MIKKYKLSPQWHKLISDLAKELPAMQKKCGNVLMFRNISEPVIGYNLTKEETAKIKNYKSSATYIRRGKEPVLVNHKLNLISEFELKGQDGVKLYCEKLSVMMDNWNDKISKTN